MRGIHDVGGLDLGPVPIEDHDHEEWERRANALVQMLISKSLVRIDEARRIGEELGPNYMRFGYFERVMHAVAQLVLVHGLISTDELARALEHQTTLGR